MARGDARRSPSGRRHGGVGPGLARVCDRLDACIGEGHRTGIFQSTIVHTVLLLVLALSFSESPERERRVRLTVDFSSQAVAPDQGTDEMAEPSFDAADAANDMGNVDAAVAEFMVEPAVASVTVDDLTSPDITVTGFGEDVTGSVVSERDLLAELPAVSTEPPSRPVARTVAAASGGGRAGVIAAAVNGAGMNDGALHGLGPGGGIGGEMGRRLAAAGARTGDVQISIAWNGIDDIDLHVQVEPLQGGGASWISWMCRLGFCGGMLDVDANAMPNMLTPTPVENVFWAKGMAPFGRYTVAVHNFRNWSGRGATPVEMAVLVDGTLQRFRPVAVAGRSMTVVHSFVRKPPVAAGGAAPAPLP